MDTNPIPELLQAEWGLEQVLQLFADLSAGAEVEHVQLRTLSGDGVSTLDDACRQFRAGTALAIQVRYRFEGEYWIDTIVPGIPTTKIIRNHLPDSLATGQ